MSAKVKIEIELPDHTLVALYKLKNEKSCSMNQLIFNVLEKYIYQKSRYENFKNNEEDELFPITVYTTKKNIVALRILDFTGNIKIGKTISNVLDKWLKRVFTKNSKQLDEYEEEFLNGHFDDKY